jgi:phage gp36-like protein
MSFLEQTDYNVSISTDLLNQIIDGDEDLLDNAESDSAQIITDRIGDKYSVDSELQKQGDERNRTLVRWMRVLSMYYIYGRIPDEQIPERVVKDYDDVIKELDKISSGKYATSLARIEVDGTVKTSIRMGSNAQRTHNPYA